MGVACAEAAAPLAAHLRELDPQRQGAIIFPTQGARSLPDSSAGGDLDGDPYALFWNERLASQPVTGKINH